jgi:hypothetical protein
LKAIDHNPHERRLGNGIWWLAWTIVALLWLGAWYFWGFDWHQVLLAFVTGSMRAT